MANILVSILSARLVAVSTAALYDILRFIMLHHRIGTSAPFLFHFFAIIWGFAFGLLSFGFVVFFCPFQFIGAGVGIDSGQRDEDSLLETDILAGLSN